MIETRNDPWGQLPRIAADVDDLRSHFLEERETGFRRLMEEVLGGIKAAHSQAASRGQV